MKKYVPDFINIDENALNDQITQNVLAKFPTTPYEVVSFKSDFLNEDSDKNISKSKRILNLRHNNGHFIERCPGTKEHICCNYFIANIAVNCHFDCTYCFLQSYLNDHSITVYTNIDKLLEELDDLDLSSSGQEIRIGTGELADSLAMDELTEFSKILVPYFKGKKNLTLELKTKSNYIENLLECTPDEKTVISWSVNPPNIILSEEHKCSSLDERLTAAKACSEKGYKIAFHFDPIIVHEGWEENYNSTVDRIFEFVDPKVVQWISLGVLRFSPAGKEAIRRRFPKSDITYSEMVQCSDGKLRYPQFFRKDIYQHLNNRIYKHDKDLFTYLCMETNAIWSKVYGENSSAAKAILQF